MRVDEAKAALERAGYVVETAERVPGLFNVEGLGRDLTEGQLIQLAHRHGVWRPAFERAHSAGPPARPPEAYSCTCGEGIIGRPCHICGGLTAA